VALEPAGAAAAESIQIELHVHGVVEVQLRLVCLPIAQNAKLRMFLESRHGEDRSLRMAALEIGVTGGAMAVGDTGELRLAAMLAVAGRAAGHERRIFVPRPVVT